MDCFVLFYTTITYIHAVDRIENENENDYTSTALVKISFEIELILLINEAKSCLPKHKHFKQMFLQCSVGISLFMRCNIMFLVGKALNVRCEFITLHHSIIHEFEVIWWVLANKWCKHLKMYTHLYLSVDLFRSIIII